MSTTANVMPDSPQLIPYTPPELKEPTTFDEAEATWRAERRTFIGGSELYKLFNLRQYGKGCSLALAFEKLGYEGAHEFEPEDEALLKRGHIMEQPIAEIYRERTGRQVKRPVALNKFGFPKRVLRHRNYPFLGVHTDRMILAGYGDVKKTGDLEIKSHGEGYFWRIKRTGLPFGHVLQVQGGLLVTERTWGSLAMVGIFGGLPLEYADTVPDGKIHDSIKEAGEKFWTGLVTGHMPSRLPDKDDERCQVCPFRVECRGEAVNADAVAFMRKNAKSDKELIQIKDPDLMEDIAALSLLTQEVRALDHAETKTIEPGAIQKLEAKILAQLKEQQIDHTKKPFVPGVASLAIVETLVPAHLDQKRLKMEKPEIHKQYWIDSVPTGDLSIRVYPIKG